MDASLSDFVALALSEIVPDKLALLLNAVIARL